MQEVVSLYLERIRREKPLIHHITNYVVANETANLTLAIGALPVMTYAHPEVEEMVSLARALLINIGTLDEYQVEAMIRAGKKANEIGVPIVLDPVGAGATAYRTDVSRHLLKELKISVVRGNRGEISILAGYKAQVSGVEAVGETEWIETAVKELAQKYGCVAVASGEVDFISDGRRLYRVKNGHPMLGALTGTGCMATTMTAAFAAVVDDYLEAAVYASAAFGIAGELAYYEAGDNPGTYHQKIYDAVYSLTDEKISEMARIEME
jgi:hydroxyethylthiazole kinase